VGIAGSSRRLGSLGPRRCPAARERVSPTCGSHVSAAVEYQISRDTGRAFAADNSRWLVTQVDDDGNELSGVRLPNISVPLATYTGWSFRSPSIGQPDELLPLTGSFIPFRVTKQDREKASDPRPSIEERYRGRDQYRSLVTDAAMKLVKQGYVLEADVSGVVERALGNWDTLTGGTSLAGK
jgi:hypothetical protein